MKKIRTIPGGRGGKLTPFEPGERRVGRPAGAPNKTTRILKEAGILAAEIVGFQSLSATNTAISYQARFKRRERTASSAISHSLRLMNRAPISAS